VNGLPNPNYDPNMRNPQYRGQPDIIAPLPCVNEPNPCVGTVGADGGGDVDIAVGFDTEAVENPVKPPTLAYSSLVLGNISSQRSTDRGATFTQNPLGNVTGGETERQLHMAPLAATLLGLPSIPTTRFENACATSHVGWPSDSRPVTSCMT